ncbi:MAG: GNAT family protein [Candidatus Berkelbacteria bacterium]
MKIIQEFTTKKNRKVQIVEPTMDLLDEVLAFANKLAKENTFLSFDPGKKIMREDEEKWLATQIERNTKGISSLRWVIFDGKIIGSVDIYHGMNVREYHIGTIGIMVDRDFRGEGLGTFLMEMIFDCGRKMGLRTAILDVFSDNEPARALYAKVGMKEYGILPDGLYRNKRFSDKIMLSKRLL